MWGNQSGVVLRGWHYKVMAVCYGHIPFLQTVGMEADAGVSARDQTNPTKETVKSYVPEQALGEAVVYDSHKKHGVDRLSYSARSTRFAHGCIRGHNSAAHSESHREEGISSPSWSYPSTALGKRPLC